MKKSIGIPSAALGAVAVGAVVSLGISQVAESAPAPAPAPQARTGTEVGAAAAAKPKPPKVVATVSSGSSEWRGEKLRHPDGGFFHDDVLRWANTAVAVMEKQGIPRKYLPGILAQIDQESDGDPKLTNDWDSNAAAGTPSKGLLQVIGPTFLGHVPKQWRDVKYQTVPYINLWAALHYAQDRYGMEKFDEWNAGNNSAY